MSVFGGLDRSMSISGNLPSNFVTQQQLKCVEERVKLVDMKMDTIMSAIGEVAIAIDRNYTRLKEVFDAISGPSSNSQQNLGELSAQLKGIQDLLHKGFSSHVASNSKIDTQPEIEVENFRKATAIAEQDKSEDNEKERFQKEFGNDVEQLSEVPYKDKIEKKQSSSSSPSSCISSGQGSMRKKKSAKKLIEIPAKSSNDEPASKLYGKKIKHSSPTSNTQESAKDVIQEPVKPVVQEPAKTTIQEEPIKKSAQGDSIKRISFKDVNFRQWMSATKKIENVGQGKLYFQSSKPNVLIKFTSHEKRLKYWMEVGEKLTTIGDEGISLLFRCYENPEFNGPVKTMLATFSDPNMANGLIRFFKENCQKADAS